MALQIVSKSGVSTAATSVDVTVGSLQASDYRLVFIGISGTTITTASGWTKSYDQAIVTSSTRRIYLFTRVYQAGDGTANFAFGTNAQFGLCVINLRIVDGTTPISVGPSHNGSDTNGTTLTAPAQSPATSGLLLAFFTSFSISASETLTTPTGMSLERTNVGNGTSGLANILGSQQVLAGSTDTRVSTAGVTAPWAAMSLVVKADNPAPPALFLPF